MSANNVIYEASLEKRFPCVGQCPSQLVNLTTCQIRAASDKFHSLVRIQSDSCFLRTAFRAKCKGKPRSF